MKETSRDRKGVASRLIRVGDDSVYSRCNGIQYGLGVTWDFYTTPLGDELAVWSDQKGAAHDTQVAFAIEYFFLDYVESLAPVLVHIGK